MARAKAHPGLIVLGLVLFLIGGYLLGSAVVAVANEDASPFVAPTSSRKLTTCWCAAACLSTGEPNIRVD